MRATRSTSSRTLRSDFMLIVLLWIAIFLDVLDSFTPRSRVGIANSNRVIRNRQASVVDSENDVTIVLPPSIEDKTDYPSPLHKIYIHSILSDEEAQKCYKIARQYGQSTGSWDSPDFERHQSYATCDFPVEECQDLQDYLEEIDFDGRLWEKLSECYDISYEDMTYLDLFCAHYQAKDGDDESGKMDRLEAHRDGSLLAFSLLLNSPDEFEGGGTFYDALRDVPPNGELQAGGIIRPSRAGDIVLHCGKILHGADVVTAGSRTVLVGFIDVSERCQRRGALAEACTGFGRMDVAANRYKRQLEKNNRGWVLNNDRWIAGHSHIRGFAPAFSSAMRRADPEYQRQEKLISEDILLRMILLPENERVAYDIFDGEITIL